MEAFSARSIKSGESYEHLFPAASGNEITTKANADVEDTLRLIRKVVKNTLADTEKLAPKLKGKDTYETCSHLWHFVYGHIQYRKDRKGAEQVRRPARTWRDRKPGVDCDCYSVFISSVLTNLGIPHKLRVTKYHGKSYYQHIYVIVPKPNGEYVTLDCVKDAFDEEEPYSDKKDYAMEPNYLDGLDSTDRSQPVSVDLLDMQVAGLGILDAGWEGVEGLGYIQREKAESALQDRYGYVPTEWTEDDYAYVEGLGSLKRFGNWVKTKAAPVVGKVVGTAVSVGSGIMTGGPAGALHALNAAKQRKEELKSQQEAQKTIAQATQATQAEAELRRVEEENRKAEQERTMQQMQQMQNSMLSTLSTAVSRMAPETATATTALTVGPPASSSEEKGFMAWMKKNPLPAGLVAIAVIGGGVYLATRNNKANSRGRSMDGLPRKAKRRKRSAKRKAKTVIF